MDQVATENVHSSLPPCLSEGTMYSYRVLSEYPTVAVHDLLCIGEKACTVEVRGSEWRDGRVVGSEDKGWEFTPVTEVKLARYNATR